MDAVQQANSGHPGMPLGMADIAEALWREFLSHNPEDPSFPNRDRFVLSNGHGSMLLYSLLHLTGYALSLDDIKAFRQLHSKTPGHPELTDTPGVETTTGPLGQGLANACGMAIAEKHLSAEFNEEGHTLIDHYTYVFAGDGCLMEGVSHEACSLAGTLGLGKLIAFYDDNGISIDGKIDTWFSDDTQGRFKAYGWQVIGPIDGHDRNAIIEATHKARENKTQPSLIICKTHIGYGSPALQDSAKSHGAPMGHDEIKATKKALGWEGGTFEIPNDIYHAWDAKDKGNETQIKWDKQFADYKAAFPEKALELTRRLKGDLPADFKENATYLINAFNEEAKDEATRKSSEKVLDHITSTLPELLGGSADLSGSNNTKCSHSTPITKDNFKGNYLHYGVREFGMSAIMNGLALHGGIIPYAGTFLVFSDYAKNALRLSAMMKQRVIYVYSHDSIGLGEDGPTHQPIEHITALRTIPDTHVWRPADCVETAVAWQESLGYQGASCLLLSRQTLAFQKRNQTQIEAIAKGAYILCESDETPELILIATGSELDLAVQAYHILRESNRAVRVVSMPCMDVFLNQSTAYQEHVLPRHITRRIAIEAGSPDSWYRFTGLEGRVIGINQFGYSAPANQVFEMLNITTDQILAAAENLLLENA
jgi:transketolase